MLFVFQTELVAVGWDTAVFEDVRYNFLDIFVLKNAAVLLQGKKLCKGNDLGPVEIFFFICIRAAFPGVFKFSDDPMNVTVGFQSNQG